MFFYCFISNTKQSLFPSKIVLISDRQTVLISFETAHFLMIFSHFTICLRAMGGKRAVTVLCIIELNLFPVSMRLHSGSDKLIFRRYFATFFLYLRTLCIVWSMARRRVTRRLTRLQAMRNVIKYSKIVQNGSVR